MKTALVVGSQGQDGTYLTRYLVSKRYRVIGISRHGLEGNVTKKPRTVNILKAKDVSDVLSDFAPDEIYYLAARHHSSQDRKGNDDALFQKSLDIHVRGLCNFLEGMRGLCPKARLFYAGSSHMFGRPESPVQNEQTPLNPVCIYGITKTAGTHTCRFYREKYGLFISVGILYNHESPLRSEKFVSRKIVRAAIAISRGEQKELVLGKLNAVIDWGFAGDYVEAMHKTLNVSVAQDYVIASGKAHTVEQFVRAVFKKLNLDWKQYVREDLNVLHGRVDCHWQGDSSKLKRLTGWKPGTDFIGLVNLMVDAGLKDLD